MKIGSDFWLCRCALVWIFLSWGISEKSQGALQPPLSKQMKSPSRVFPQARITVYWQDSDTWTQSLQSSSGVRLKNKRHVAVDPALIPYGSEVRIEGWGSFIAVDTGSAVVKRTAARRMGRDVPVVDVFFLSKEEALRAAKSNPVFSKVEIFQEKS
jgi:3D (Asp-Asp-Asp) domain-containing protein